MACCRLFSKSSWKFDSVLEIDSVLYGQVELVIQHVNSPWTFWNRSPIIKLLILIQIWKLRILLSSLKSKIAELESENELLRKQPAIVEQMTPEIIMPRVKVSFLRLSFSLDKIYHIVCHLTLYNDLEFWEWSWSSKRRRASNDKGMATPSMNTFPEENRYFHEFIPDLMINFVSRNLGLPSPS